MNRIAVVTGAGSGIGAAIATELHERDHTVVVTDIDQAAADRVARTLSDAHAMALDVTDADACRRVVEQVTSDVGDITVWVSNAGVSRMRRFLDITPQEFVHTVDVNLAGVFLASQAAARSMVTVGDGGTIVNMASMAGKQGRVPFLADYVASKFAVVGLTQAMACELAEHGVRVNSVCPGYVATPMQGRELAWEAELRGTTIDEVRRAWIDDTPLGRLEEPQDVARVVAFLAGPDSAFLTGESIAVNGGAFMD